MSTFADQLTQRIRYAAAQRAGAARDALESALKQAAPVGKAVPYGPEPGTLQKSISVSVRFDGTTFSFKAIAAAEHASYTNDGTPAFSYVVNRPMSPSGRPGAVRFWWGRSGNIEFRRTGHVINNPGIAATHWWTNTIQSFSGILQDAGGAIS